MILFSFLIWSSFLKKASTESTALVMAISILRKKENSIITSVSDIDQMGLDDELVKQIKLTLNGENSLDNIKPKINIPILLLYECNITKGENHCMECSHFYNDLTI
jgi:hypothetical protein